MGHRYAGSGRKGRANRKETKTGHYTADETDFQKPDTIREGVYFDAGSLFVMRRGINGEEKSQRSDLLRETTLYHSTPPHWGCDGLCKQRCFEGPSLARCGE